MAAKARSAYAFVQSDQMATIEFSVKGGCIQYTYMYICIFSNCTGYTDLAEPSVLIFGIRVFFFLRCASNRVALRENIPVCSPIYYHCFVYINILLRTVKSLYADPEAALPLC